MSTKIGVLLLHGLTGVPSEMRPMEKHFQKLGFETESATLAGHDGSNDELLAATWKDWIGSAETALTELLQRVDQVVVCGLSMGASISAILAARYPSKVCGLIMLSPTLAYDSPEIGKKLHLRLYGIKLVRDILHLAVNTVPAIGKAIYWTETPPYGLRDERLQRQITKAIEAAQRGEDTKFGLFRTYFLSLAQMTKVTNEFRKSASLVECPVLLISSLEDTLVSMSNATNAYSIIGSLNKSLSMLTGCDHVLTLDLKRNYVCRLNGEFMEAVSGQHDEFGAKYTDSGLTVEIHNRLNPLSNADWARLVPGSQPLPDLVGTLQLANVHESQCHTLVVRFNNEPILMIPIIFAPRKLNVQLGLATRVVAGLLKLFNPTKLRPRLTIFGFSENCWGNLPPSGGDTEMISGAWKLIEDITAELSSSYKAPITGFVHANLGTITAARVHKVAQPSIGSWLAEHSILENLTTTGSSIVPTQSPEHS